MAYFTLVNQSSTAVEQELLYSRLRENICSLSKSQKLIDPAAHQSLQRKPWENTLHTSINPNILPTIQPRPLEEIFQSYVHLNTPQITLNPPPALDPLKEIAQKYFPSLLPATPLTAATECYILKISNPENGVVYEESLENQAYKELKKSIDISSHPRSKTFLSALLAPVRTNHLNNFVKDFFLPTVMNRAMKVENIALRCFVILGSLFLDIPTLLFIRIFTFIPKVISNALREKTDFHRFLIEGIKAGQVDPNLILSGRVQVEFTGIQTPTKHFTKIVNLIEMPD